MGAASFPVRARSRAAASWLILLSFLAGVTGLTLAQRAGAFTVNVIAASPKRIEQGEVWLVLTSAPVAQRPALLSLLSFGALAVIALLLCGSSILWLSAVVGHAGSTLLLYLFIGVAASTDRDGFGRLLSEPDYGISAIFAAWLGAVACWCWLRKRGAWGEKLGLILICSGVGLVAWLIRGEPTPSLLDSEHLLAFAIGGGIAFALGRRARRADAGEV